MDNAQDTNQQALILVYEQIIGRPPTPAELALNEQQVGSGISIATLRAYLASTGYAAAALAKLYSDVVGRAVTAPELEVDQSCLANGGSLATLRGYLAGSNEGVGKTQALYAAVVGRVVTAPELASDQSYLTNGGSLAGLRGSLASSNEAAVKLQALHTDVVGRAITSGELSGEQAAIGAGTVTLTGLRNYLATTNEAGGKLQALYTTELERAITPGEAATDERLIAGGSSLAAIRRYLSTSAEAARDLTARFQTVFGTAAPFNIAPATADLASAEQTLAAGAGQPSAVAGTPGVASFIDAGYRLLLGVAPSAAEAGAIKQGIMDHLAGPSLPRYTLQANSLAEQAITAVAAASPEFANDINAAFQAAVGRPASAVELAAARSELGAGWLYGSPQNTVVTVATLRTQIAELSGGAPPQVGEAGNSVNIGPQTVLGRPGFIYGLPNNDVLISAQPTGVQASFHGSGSASIVSFNAATDILQIPKQQAASFSDLTLSQTVLATEGAPNTHIDLHGGATIDLLYTPKASLTVANFQFV